MKRSAWWCLFASVLLGAWVVAADEPSWGVPDLRVVEAEAQQA